MVVLLVPSCPLPGAAEGVRAWSGAALTEPVHHMHCLWVFLNQHWCALGSPSSRKGSGLVRSNVE